MPYKDPAVRKAKHKEYSRKFYVNNRQKTIDSVKMRKQALYEWWRALKATLGCFGCDESDPECIDFHHVITSGKREAKDSANHWVYQYSWKKERVVEEIWKTCVPLCSNCHRKVHTQHKRWLKEANDALSR